MLKRIPEIIRDVLILGGIGGIVTGCWWIWPPLGLIVAGVVAVALGVLWQEAVKEARQKQEHEKRSGL